jgi:hypothetical protein
MANGDPLVTTLTEDGRRGFHMDFGQFSYTLVVSDTIAPDEVTENQIAEEIAHNMLKRGPRPRRTVSYAVRDALLAGTRRR